MNCKKFRIPEWCSYYGAVNSSTNPRTCDYTVCTVHTLCSTEMLGTTHTQRRDAITLSIHVTQHGHAHRKTKWSHKEAVQLPALNEHCVLQIGRSLVRFQMVSLESFIDIILPIALWPWGRLSLLTEMSTRSNSWE